MEPRRRRGVPLLSQPLSDGLNLGEHLLAGGAATAAAVTSVHPLDTVKTVMQAGRSRGNAFGAFLGVVRRRGVGALYSGVGSSLSGQVPSGAIKFAVFEGLTQTIHNRAPNIPKPVADFACAAAAMVACSFVFVPGEVLKQRIQAGLQPNMVSALRGALKERGVRGLYAGYAATLLRDVPYTMLEFGLYSQYKRVARFALKRQRLRPQEEWALGGLAGGCTGFLTTPLDFAKTKLMTQSATTGQYLGVMDVLRKTTQSEGVGGLFRGSSARVAWLIPFTAVFFGVHEASKRALKDRKLPTTTAAHAKAKAF